MNSTKCFLKLNRFFHLVKIKAKSHLILIVMRRMMLQKGLEPLMEMIRSKTMKKKNTKTPVIGLWVL